MGIYTTDMKQTFYRYTGNSRQKQPWGIYGGICLQHASFSDTVLSWCQLMSHGKGDDITLSSVWKPPRFLWFWWWIRLIRFNSHRSYQIDDFRNQMDFKEIVPIQILQGNNVSHLIDILSENLEESPVFPSWSNHRSSWAFLVSENDSWEGSSFDSRRDSSFCRSSGRLPMKRDEESDKIHIRATIMVERDSQKWFNIGKRWRHAQENRGPWLVMISNSLKRRTKKRTKTPLCRCHGRRWS